ncbi:hypothetical protein CIB48_g2296 [Xylaria polymorpha]|nr:hypothetical protein CIB48_g2296 [Xylaria polymorpha]
MRIPCYYPQANTTIGGRAFQSTDDMSRAPVWRTRPEPTQQEHSLTMMPEEPPWEVVLQETNNREELYPPAPSVPSESQVTTPDDLTSEESDENNSDDCEGISEDTDSNHWNDEGEDYSSDDSNFNRNSTGEYCTHTGTLRGVLDGVLCEFTPGNSFLNTNDPWFPYMQYPRNFKWTCCGDQFGCDFCYNNPPSPPDIANLNDHIVPNSW